MMYALPYKTKQFFFVLIKLSVVVGSFYFIYHKIANNSHLSFQEFIQLLIKNNTFSPKNIIFLLILSLLNWFFEILKWKILVSSVTVINFKNAIWQCLGSLTASLFTPNRIGEYGAKAIYFKPKLRKRIVLVNLMSNMLQMSVTVLLGSIGVYFYILKYNPDINYYRISKFLILIVIALIFLSLGITSNKFKIKGFSLEKIKRFVIEYPKTKLLVGFLFSLIRYFIFSFQFYFLMQIFHIELGYLEAMSIITSMYLLASIVPSVFIFDVVIKGSVAVYLFSLAGINDVIILAIIMLMWLLNFVFPSIIGSYFVLQFKLPKSKIES